jgi:hypothetical protein
MSEYALPLCYDCKHYRPSGTDERDTCTAFPKGIPDEIYFEAGDHTKPLAG